MLNYQRVPSGSYLYIAMENHQFFLNTKNMGHFRYVNVFWRLKYRSCILNGTKNLDFHQERTQTRRMPSREKQSFIEINEPIYPIIVGCNISVYIYMGLSIYIYISLYIPFHPHDLPINAWSKSRQIVFGAFLRLIQWRSWDHRQTSSAANMGTVHLHIENLRRLDSCHSPAHEKVPNTTAPPY